MGLSSRELWESTEAGQWEACLRMYWEVPSVKNNQQIEEELDVLSQHRDVLFQAGSVAWYRLLKDKYLPWKLKSQPTYTDHIRKFVGRYANNFDELDQVKRELQQADKANRGACLRIVTRVDQMGIPVASGLMAVLYPEHFGTLDQKILRALRSIPDVNERLMLDERTRGNDTYLSGDKTNPARLQLATELMDVLAEKASENNRRFRTNQWTPRKIDMVIWTCESIKS